MASGPSEPTPVAKSSRDDVSQSKNLDMYLLCLQFRHLEKISYTAFKKKAKQEYQKLSGTKKAEHIINLKVTFVKIQYSVKNSYFRVILKRTNSIQQMNQQHQKKKPSNHTYKYHDNGKKKMHYEKLVHNAINDYYKLNSISLDTAGIY